MCGRFCIAASPGELSERYGLEIPLSYQPGYNISPGRSILVVLGNPSPKTAMIHWGLQGKSGLIVNIGVEKFLEKNAGQSDTHEIRCLIPASGYYEWKKERTQKKPFYFSSSSARIISFAGIFKEERSGSAVAMLTMDAPEEIASCHHRMPVILTQNTEELYLSHAETPRYPIEQLKWHEVSIKVNQVSCDKPELISPIRQTSSQKTLYD